MMGTLAELLSAAGTGIAPSIPARDILAARELLGGGHEGGGGNGAPGAHWW